MRQVPASMVFLSLDGVWLLIMSPLPDREFEEGPAGLRLLASAQCWVNPR